MRRTQYEQMRSGLLPKADFGGSTADVADVPHSRHGVPYFLFASGFGDLTLRSVLKMRYEFGIR